MDVKKSLLTVPPTIQYDDDQVGRGGTLLLTH